MPQNSHCAQLEWVSSYRCVHVLGLATEALRWMMQTKEKGIPAGQGKGAGVLNHKPIKVMWVSTGSL